MSQIHYAMSYQCDCCGRMAVVNPPHDHMSMRNVPVPPGWMTYNRLPDNEDSDFSIMFRSGRSLHHPDVCDDCKWIPYQTVIERMIERYQDK